MEEWVNNSARLCARSESRCGAPARTWSTTPRALHLQPISELLVIGVSSLYVCHDAEVDAGGTSLRETWYRRLK
ncbi:hypothetical protein AMELA_G00220720 [Ameiurus melas]|uniref:Uncharacterized protein n=1 Tax=Ameiurus melas TaxID=219545 RepID=A0A7J6A070_AMEME|nr:hypothetical protein AMELA_G00220720 [Ameiurus melas]